MLSINLLPPKEKKIVRLEETRRIIKVVGETIFTVFITASIMLLPSYFPFFLESREFRRSLQIEEEARDRLKIKETLLRVRTLKKTLDSIRNPTPDSAKKSYIFEGLIPEGKGIIISNISISKKGEVALTGTAKTRSDLLDYEKKLRDSNILQQVSLPISPLTKETDINFNIQGKLRIL